MSDICEGETLNGVFVQSNGIIRNSIGLMIGSTMSRYEHQLKSLDSYNTILEGKVRELEEILATHRYRCVTCKRSVEPDECYSLVGTDVIACSDKCLDAYED